MRGRLAAFALLALLPATVHGQESETPFVETAEAFRVFAALQMVGNGDPVGAACVRVIGSEQALLHPHWRLEADEAPPQFKVDLTSPVHPLRKEELDLVVDRTPVPDFTNHAPKGTSLADRAYYMAYNHALSLASATEVERFIEAAKPNKDLDFITLFEHAQENRGKVVEVKGRMILLRKHVATKPAIQQGIEHVYEGWVMGPTRHANPFCVQFITLPPGLEPAEQMDRRVAFYGYFLKVIRYKSGDVDRYTPLLVGPTVLLDEEKAEPRSPFTRDVLYATVLGLFSLMLLGVGLMAWFRRGDLQTQALLQRARDKRGLTLPEPLDEPDDAEPRNGLPHDHQNGHSP